MKNIQEQGKVEQGQREEDEMPREKRRIRTGNENRERERIKRVGVANGGWP